MQLPYQQLTQLRLWNSDVTMTNLLAMSSALPSLEEFEVKLGAHNFDLFELDAATLSRWPQLRLIDLSHSRLWEEADIYSEEFWSPQKRTQAPMRTVEQLMRLQRACPRIEWVLRDPE